MIDSQTKLFRIGPGLILSCPASEMPAMAYFTKMESAYDTFCELQDTAGSGVLLKSPRAQVCWEAQDLACAADAVARLKEV